jgi:hypothetical protein
MPSMLRIPGKARKIAYSLLGVPANIRSKKSKREKEINRQLIFQETVRAR